MNHYIKNSAIDKVFVLISRAYILFFAAVCFLPLLFVISGSITDESSIMQDGFRLIPGKISFKAYNLAFDMPETIFRAYGVSIIVTLVGTIFSLFMISMTAYVLHNKAFKYRNAFALYFYLTTIFGGGLVPWYILIVRYFHLKDNMLALILPGLFNVLYMIIIRSFLNTVPYSLNESAKIDGAGEFRIYAQIILPLSKPALASMGLFVALSYWNDFLNALLFIENKNLFPLQFYLYNILRKVQAVQELAGVSGTAFSLPLSEMPNESLKMAMSIITVLPVMALYPFLQKYFIKGIMIGAVKG